jgi:hypothetical protein
LGRIADDEDDLNRRVKGFDALSVEVRHDVEAQSIRSGRELRAFGQQRGQSPLRVRVPFAQDLVAIAAVASLQAHEQPRRGAAAHQVQNVRRDRTHRVS